MDTRETRFLNYYHSGLNDVEISKLLEVSPETVRQLRVKLNLKSNFSYEKRAKISKAELKKLVEQGLKDREIAQLFNMSANSIYSSRKRNKVERRTFATNLPIEFTQRQFEILKGCLLGDGSFRIDNHCINPRFSCEHGIKQKEYCQWKYNEFKNIAKFSQLKRKTVDPRTGICYESAKMYISANSSFLELYNNLYIEGKKRITKEFLQGYTALSLAVTFMDDGYKESVSIGIATNCFTTEDLKIFVDYLYDKFSIRFTITKHNKLYLPARYYKLFEYLVKPYMHESLLYKLQNVSLNRDKKGNSTK